jgi:hypothetical protein
VQQCRTTHDPKACVRQAVGAPAVGRDRKPHK